MILLFTLLLILAPPSTADRFVSVHPGESIQAAVDALAGGGGTVTLDSGATYRDVSVVLPYTLPVVYSNIRIVGNHTRLLAPQNAPKDWKLLWVGRGWSDWAATRIEGFEVSGVEFVGGSVFLDFTSGARVDGCRFTDSPVEALITGGAATNTDVSRCDARNCGKQWSAGGLAAFNLNGTNERLTNCVAINCGAGAEIGGTSFLGFDCLFDNAPIKIGSRGAGCSDVTFTKSHFHRSPVDIDNGIGKLSSINFLDGTHIDSPISWNGCAPTNRVAQPGLTFYDRRSVIQSNTFIGAEGLRLTNWRPDYVTPPLLFAGNQVNCPDSGGIVIQSMDVGDIEIVDNSFSSQCVGVSWLYVPSGPVTDQTSRLTWKRNRLVDGAYLRVNNGSKEWHNLVR